MNVKWSSSASQDAFWLTVLRWRKARIVLGHAAGQYNMKPPQPGRWHPNNSYIPQGFIHWADLKMHHLLKSRFLSGKICLFTFETTDKVSFYCCISHTKMAPVGPQAKTLSDAKVRYHQIPIHIARGLFQRQISPSHLLQKVLFPWHERLEQGC